MYWRNILAFLLTASAASAGTVTVSGFTQSAITTAISSACNGTAAGTVIFPNGSYSVTSTITLPANCTLQGQNRRGATLTSSSQFTIIQVNGNTTAIDGLIFNSGGIAFGSANQYTGFNFTNNTIQNMTAAATGANGFGLTGNGLKNGLIDSNIIQNLWPGGWPSTPNYSSGNGCTWTGADCWGPGGIVFSSLDNVSITNNFLDKIAMDAIYIDWESTTGNTGGYTTTNDVIAYNTISHNRRNPIELQSQPSGGCPGGCNFGLTNTTNLQVKGNYIHSYSFHFGDNYGSSLVPNGNVNGFFGNNTYVALDDPLTPGANSRLADCQETAGNNLIVQGNACLSPTGTAQVYPGGYPIGTSTQVTIQNTLSCGISQFSYTEGPAPHGLTSQYNYYTNGTCPQSNTLDVSSITPAFTSANNQNFPNGGNGTWNFGVVSNFSIKWVRFFIDGSTTPVTTQEIQDVSTTFATDRQWLYHATLNTTPLGVGTHTIVATATDVSGMAQSQTQTFTVGPTGNTVNCANSASDAAAIQSAVNGGGTVSIVGTCNIGATTITVGSNVAIQGSGSNGNTSGHGATSNTTLTYTGTTYAFNAGSSSNVTVTGLTISGGGIYLNSTSAGQGGIVITHNTIQNVTNSTGAGVLEDNILGKTGAPNVISDNDFTNIWPGGWPTSGSRTQGSGAIFLHQGVDNTTIDYNFFNKTSANAIKGFLDGFQGAGSPQGEGAFVAHNVVISNNDIQQNARIGIEFQAVGECSSGCDYSVKMDGVSVKGNYVHNMVTPISNFYAYSLLFSSTHSSFINNTAVNGNNSAGSCTFRLAIALENAMNGGTLQGNVMSSVQDASPCTKDGGGPVGWQAIEASGFTQSSSYIDTFSNNVYCQPNTNWHNTDGSDLATYVYQYEYQSTTCPSGLTSEASGMNLAFTSSNNQSFQSGGNGTWSASVISNLSIRNVSFYVDGATLPVATQEIQDVNTNFANDRQWLYHLTLNTSGLAVGSHTITATATDVTSASQSQTQNFTTTSSTQPIASLNQNLLSFVSPSIGTPAPSQTITLSNTGSVILNITSIGINGPNASEFSGSGTCGSSLAAGASCTVTVTWTPASAGSKTATLSFTDNAPGSPQNVTLNGAIYTSLQPGTYNIQVTGGGNTLDGGWYHYGGDVVIHLFTFNNGPDQQFAFTPSHQFKNVGTGLFLFNSGGILKQGPSGDTFVVAQQPGGGYTIADGALYVNPPAGTGTAFNVTLSSTPTTMIVPGIAVTPCSITPTSLSSGSVNVSYTATFAAASTCASSSWSTTGTLPPGLSFNSGILTGTPTVTGNFSFTVTYGATSQGETISVSSSPIVSCPITIPAGGTVICTAPTPTNWTKPAGSVATLSGSLTNSASVTVMAPAAAVYAPNVDGGCPVTPGDSIYSTRIDSLPVHSLSGTWIANLAALNITLNGVVGSWETNVLDNTDPIFASPLYFYTTAYNGVPIQYSGLTNPTNLSHPSKRENGRIPTNIAGLSINTAPDHHQVNVNAVNCQRTEIYDNHDGNVLGILCDRIGHNTGCFATSAWQYPSYGYVEPHINTLDTPEIWGTTDAGGLPLTPLTLQYDELAYAAAHGTAVPHPLRITPAGGYVQQSYSSGGCNQCRVLWPATSTASGGNATNAVPMGSWFRVKSTYSPTCAGAMCRAVIRTLQQYGGIVADNAAGFVLTVGQSIYSHADGVQAMLDVQNLNVPITQFDIIDPTSLEIDDDTTHAPYMFHYSQFTTANPANGFVTIPNSMVVCGGTSCVPISITPITLGFQEQYQWVVAGSSFTPRLFINGSTATPVYAVNSCSSGAGNCGTYVNGVYTAPTTVTYGSQFTATLTATIGNAVTPPLYLTIVPPPTITKPLAFDIGSSVPFTGCNGVIWLPDTFPRYGEVISLNNYPGDSNFSVGPNGSLIPDYQLYQTAIYTYSDYVLGPIQGLTPGNYNVSIYQGGGGGGNGGECDSRSGMWSYISQRHSFGFLEAGGVIAAHDYDYMVYDHYQCFNPVITTVPMVVGPDGIGLFSLRSSQDESNGYRQTFPSLAAIRIMPAASVSPGIAVDAEAEQTQILPDGTLQFFDVPQWLGAGYDYTKTTWSTSGPGTISAGGLYSAPPSTPPWPPVAERIAAGWIYGTSFTDSYATFGPDQYFTGGAENGLVTNTVSATGVTNPAPLHVYQDARFSSTPIIYTMPNLGAGSTITVRLHFAETFCTAAGCHVFSVKVNGATVLTNYDIWADVGANQAVVKQFTATADASGKVTIEFDPAPGSLALVSGVEAIPVTVIASAPPPFKVTVPVTITANNGHLSGSTVINVIGPQYPLTH